MVALEKVIPHCKTYNEIYQNIMFTQQSKIFNFHQFKDFGLPVGQTKLDLTIANIVHKEHLAYIPTVMDMLISMYSDNKIFTAVHSPDEENMYEKSLQYLDKHYTSNDIDYDERFFTENQFKFKLFKDDLVEGWRENHLCWVCSLQNSPEEILYFSFLWCYFNLNFNDKFVFSKDMYEIHFFDIKIEI